MGQKLEHLAREESYNLNNPVMPLPCPVQAYTGSQVSLKQAIKISQRFLPAAGPFPHFPDAGKYAPVNLRHHYYSMT